MYENFDKNRESLKNIKKTLRNEEKLCKSTKIENFISKERGNEKWHEKSKRALNEKGKHWK